MRHVSVWVSESLGKRLDRARDMAPMRRFVERLLEQAVSSYERARRVADELPPKAKSFSLEVGVDGVVTLCVKSVENGEVVETLYKI